MLCHKENNNAAAITVVGIIELLILLISGLALLIMMSLQGINIDVIIGIIGIGAAGMLSSAILVRWFVANKAGGK